VRPVKNSDPLVSVCPSRQNITSLIGRTIIDSDDLKINQHLVNQAF
jgi:hypothetical protein